MKVTPLKNSSRTGMRRELLTWFSGHRRELPWRENPSPYAVWVSEIMLQQTRVEVVKEYFRRWMLKFPDVSSLARAGEAEVLSVWQGLGYYSRAKRLRSGAQYVLESLGGRLPSHPDELMKIPGIGPYSAGAISSIAFGQPSAIVDGNVIRVLCRVFALKGDPNKAPLKGELWRLAQQLVPAEQPGEFNQGLMELGALTCTPRQPVCTACPWRKRCVAFARGETARFPELPQRAPPTKLAMVLVFLRHHGHFALVRLPEDAQWWAGLEAFPFDRVGKGGDPLSMARSIARELISGDEQGQAVVLSPIVHAVTRFKITLTPVLLKLNGRRITTSGVQWLPLDELTSRTLPAPHRRALASLCEKSGRG